jgi:hypothetical protein
MTSSILEELSPSYVGAKAISLSLVDPLTPLRAFSTIRIAVDYSDCLPSGIVLPLVLLVVGPSSTSFRRDVFHRVSPSEVAFRPVEGGVFGVTLKELAHNHFWGHLSLEIDGDQVLIP